MIFRICTPIRLKKSELSYWEALFFDNGKLEWLKNKAIGNMNRIHSKIETIEIILSENFGEWENDEELDE